MAANKTSPSSTAAVDQLIAGIDDERRADDCRTLVQIMRRVTKHEPVLWGASIVGFDQYHYRYDSGREGDSCVLGFSSGKAKFSLYGIGRDDGALELLERLGKHALGKGCVYVNNLSDVDLTVLEDLLRHAYSSRT